MKRICRPLISWSLFLGLIRPGIISEGELTILVLAIVDACPNLLSFSWLPRFHATEFDSGISGFRPLMKILPKLPGVTRLATTVPRSCAVPGAVLRGELSHERRTLDVIGEEDEEGEEINAPDEIPLTESSQQEVNCSTLAKAQGERLHGVRFFRQ